MRHCVQNSGQCPQDDEMLTEPGRGGLSSATAASIYPPLAALVNLPRASSYRDPIQDSGLDLCCSDLWWIAPAAGGHWSSISVSLNPVRTIRMPHSNPLELDPPNLNQHIPLRLQQHHSHHAPLHLKSFSGIGRCSKLLLKYTSFSSLPSRTWLPKNLVTRLPSPVCRVLADAGSVSFKLTRLLSRYQRRLPQCGDLRSPRPTPSAGAFCCAQSAGIDFVSSSQLNWPIPEASAAVLVILGPCG